MAVDAQVGPSKFASSCRGNPGASERESDRARVCISVACNFEVAVFEEGKVQFTPRFEGRSQLTIGRNRTGQPRSRPTLLDRPCGSVNPVNGSGLLHYHQPSFSYCGIQSNNVCSVKFDVSEVFPRKTVHSQITKSNHRCLFPDPCRLWWQSNTVREIGYFLTTAAIE
jgi:hypothetical protein